jgi:hypothetical protein
VSRLFPDGIEHLADLPHTFHDALVFALQILSWEELPKDERPPRNIWLDPKALNAHFKRVDRMRKEKYGGGSDDDDIDGPVSHNAALDMMVK